ncbi:MAG: hypothetical protein KUG81_02275 [Gammaproteobacteria bacterium]|nr:hypothetical protein [Gammaproteobacteria bacterium]
MNTEEKTMHQDFADWMSHVNIKSDRESLALRWQTISRLVYEEGLSKDYLDDLIRFIFGIMLPSARIEELQTAFKIDDSFFSNDANKNHQELLALAVSIIYLHLEDVDSTAANLGLHILTAYCVELRSPKHGDDLISKAQSAVITHATEIRKRKKQSTKDVATKWDSTLDELASEDPPEAIKLLTPIVKRTCAALNYANQTISSLEKHITTKDEELEILWWVFVGYSDLLNKPFTDIENILRSIVCGIELANHTSLGSEPPALKGLLSKCLSEPQQNISFDELGGNNIVIHASIILDSQLSHICPILAPIHYLVKCVQDIGEHWQKKWSRDTGLKPEMKMSSIDLSIQLCRERLQLTNSEY